jgi:chorismate dehydratase
MIPAADAVQTAGPLRFGAFTFLNSATIRQALRRLSAEVQLDIHLGEPADIAARLLGDRLDMGMVSVVEYLRHSESLTLIPTIGISARGPVRSCTLVTRVLPQHLDGETVSVSSTTRTTAELLRLLLEERYGARPEFVQGPPRLDAMLRDAPAALVIGDPALVAYHDPSLRRRCLLFDTAQMWREWTGLPMTYAVLVATRAVMSSRRTNVRAVSSRLQILLREEQSPLDGENTRGLPVTHAAASAYLEGLSFELGPSELQGIDLFRERLGIRTSRERLADAA